MSYALSGGHQKTLEAAKIILDEGGNAVDAAIAAYFVSFISEPCMASIGAGGFSIINDGKSIRVIDFFCQTPISKRPITQQEFFPITVDFGNTTEDFHVGKGSVAVPGAIAGMYKMHELYGTLPMKQLLEPAKLWALEGIALDKFQAYDFELLKGIFGLNAEMKPIFFNSNGTLKEEGDLIQMSQYSDFLEVLGREGKDLFYLGEISKSVAHDMAENGHLTREDFEKYEARVREPLSFEFKENLVHTAGFPSVGGLILTACLNEFQDNTSDQETVPMSVDHFQKLYTVFSKIKSLRNNPHLISRYLFEHFGIHARIDQKISTHKWGGTSHFNVVDKNGMTVGLTTSIGEGSGYFIPGTDMQMNNMLGEEALMPNGFHNWPPNQRLQSMMCPTIISDKNMSTKIVLGSGGAGRIPYALAQVIVNVFGLGCGTEDAIDMPRLHLSEKQIECEDGFDIHELGIENLNTWKNQSLFFGGVNSIEIEKTKKKGFADKRRFGSCFSS